MRGQCDRQTCCNSGSSKGGDWQRLSSLGIRCRRSTGADPSSRPLWIELIAIIIHFLADLLWPAAFEVEELGESDYYLRSDTV